MNGTWENGVYRCDYNGTECAFDSKDHSYSIGGRPALGVTSVLKEVGLIDEQWWTSEARTRGTIVHRACELLNKGTLNWRSLDPRFVPYVAAYKRFKEESGFKVIYNEQPIFSPTFFVATILDNWGDFPDEKNVLLEIKTGEEQPWWKIQLGGQDFILGKKSNRRSLRLYPTGKYKLSNPYRDQGEISLFVSCATLAHWKRNNMKGSNNGTRT